MSQGVKFPYDQQEIYEKEIVFFAKRNVCHYQKVTEPNIYPDSYSMFVPKEQLDSLKEENERLRQALTKGNLLQIIEEWQMIWRNQSINPDDTLRYRRRALSVDANMRGSLARMISEKALAGGQE